MTLAEYLSTTGTTAAAFARQIGSKRQNVFRWKTKSAVPRAADMKRISEETKGAVTANDFYGVAP